MTADKRHICDYPTCSVRGSGHPLACGCRSANAPAKTTVQPQHADTPDEATMVERVARAIAVTLDPYGGGNSAWLYRRDARAAVVAMHPEMAAAHEAGRRAGLEDAIAACETEWLGWIENGGGPGVIAAAECRKAIRALIQFGAATEAGHG